MLQLSLLVFQPIEQYKCATRRATYRTVLYSNTMQSIPSVVIEEHLFALLVDSLDYQSASRIARTAKQYRAGWMQVLLTRAIPQLAACYRGIALRRSVQLLANISNSFKQRLIAEQQQRVHSKRPLLDPTVPFRVPARPPAYTDDQCIEISQLFGLAVCSEEHRLLTSVGYQLSAVQSPRNTHMAALFPMWDHDVSLNCPEMLCSEPGQDADDRTWAILTDQSPATPFKALHVMSVSAPRAYRRHHARITNVMHQLFDCIPQLAGQLPRWLVEDALAGCYYAAPSVLAAYVRIRSPADRFELHASLFGKDVGSAKRACAANRTGLMAFAVFYSAAFTVFGFCETKTRTRKTGAFLPLCVDYTQAYEFVSSLGGLYLSDAGSPGIESRMDRLVHAKSYAESVSGHLGNQKTMQALCSYLCAQRFANGTAPLLAENWRYQAISGRAASKLPTIWNRSNGDCEFTLRAHTMYRLPQLKFKRCGRSVHVLCESNSMYYRKFTIQSMLYPYEVPLLSISRLNGDFILQWEEEAIALQCDLSAPTWGTLRCRLLALFADTHTDALFNYLFISGKSSTSRKRPHSEVGCAKQLLGKLIANR